MKFNELLESYFDTKILKSKLGSNRKYIDIYKNPTKSEINKILDIDSGVRLFSDKFGNIYAWAQQYTHDEIKINVVTFLNIIYSNENPKLISIGKSSDNIKLNDLNFKSLLRNIRSAFPHVNYIFFNNYDEKRNIDKSYYMNMQGKKINEI